jgi:hypothetical protein
MVTACFDIARVQLSEEGGDLAAKRSGQVVVACSARRMRECREGRVVCGSYACALCPTRPMCVSLVAVVKGGGAGGGWVGGSTAGKSGLSAAWIRRVAQKHLEKIDTSTAAFIQAGATLQIERSVI